MSKTGMLRTAATYALMGVLALEPALKGTALPEKCYKDIPANILELGEQAQINARICAIRSVLEVYRLVNTESVKLSWANYIDPKLGLEIGEDYYIEINYDPFGTTAAFRFTNRNTGVVAEEKITRLIKDTDENGFETFESSIARNIAKYTPYSTEGTTVIIDGENISFASGEQGSTEILSK